MAQRESGYFEKALLAYQKALDLNPSSKEAYEGIARIYVHQHKYAEAIDLLKVAIKACTTSGLLYLLRGMVNFELGNTAATLTDLKIATHLDSTLFEAYYYRAVINNSLQQFAESLTDVDHALQIQPHSVKALYTKACAQLGLRDWKGAIESSTLAIQIDASHALSYLARHEAYKKTGKHREARKDYKMYKQMSG